MQDAPLGQNRSLTGLRPKPFCLIVPGKVAKTGVRIGPVRSIDGVRFILQNSAHVLHFGRRSDRSPDHIVDRYALSRILRDEGHSAINYVRSCQTQTIWPVVQRERHTIRSAVPDCGEHSGWVLSGRGVWDGKVSTNCLQSDDLTRS